MVTTMYAKSLPDVRVTAVDPGYTATNLNGFTGTQTLAGGRGADRRGLRGRRAGRWFIGRSGAAAPGDAGVLGGSS